MCTLALYLGEFEEFPLIVAANRDEYLTRPSGDPQILVEEPLAFGGKDLLAGGTWLGVNEYGVLAGILNRRKDERDDHAAVRSRGLLCLDVLKARGPVQALSWVKQQKPSDYQPFNLLLANAEGAYIAYNDQGEMQGVKLTSGVHVIGNTSLYDARTEKVDHAYSLFSHAGRQVKDELDASFMTRLFRRGTPIWDQPSFIRLFKGILSNHMLRRDSEDPKDAICVHGKDYGTVSSSIIFYSRQEERFHFYHASKPPCLSDYEKFLSVGGA